MNNVPADDSAKPSERMSVASPAVAEDFTALFLQDQRRIHGYIVALLAGHQDADDLLQETAAVLWRRFGEFERGSNFFAWACKTARLIVLGHRRRKGREAAILNEAAFEKLASFAAHESSWLVAQTAALEECLGRLRDSDRQLLDRCYTAGITARQVAAELGRAETSVYKSLGRIRRALSECIRRSLALSERTGGD